MVAYSEDILKLIGLKHPLQVLPFLGWCKLAGAVAAMVLSDVPQVGRRHLATVGSVLCVLGNIGVAARLVAPRLVPPTAGAVFFLTIIFAWNLGYGGLLFLAVMEFLPNDRRSQLAGQVFSAASVLEMTIFQVFETLLLMSGPLTFMLFGAINMLAVWFAATVMPDFVGHSLEHDSSTSELRRETPSGCTVHAQESVP